ncbi:MAG: peptide chain release factor 2 [Candidatus Rokuibacteriota bacterium]|nr:MAG: peptide chain release factor 2 [Candidatus Rokubacteria bacterium]
MLGDLKRDIAELEKRLDDLRGHLDVAGKEARLAVINGEMAKASFWEDTRRAQGLVQERAELARTLGTFKDLVRQAEEARLLWEMATEAGDESMTTEIQEGLQRAGAALEAFELKVTLSGPQDRKNAIVSIHPGAGGTESQDWAQILMRMYLRWAERAGFKAEVVDLLAGEEAGIKSATIEFTGEYAYGYLKSEIGVHRLIRISPFDASRRRHTSFASVAVIPEVEDVEVVVKDEEIRVDVYRSSGPGGQGVNTADSAVRITHLPTGIVVACQNERSQLRNRDTAMRILRARLYQVYEKKQREELAELTGEKKEIAFGSQIRTYTFHPYQIIKDHRTGLEVGNVDAVMDGGLDPFIKAYLTGGKSAS